MMSALRAAAMQIGRAFGIGGSSWSRVRPSGDGVTAAKTLTTTTGYRLYVLRVQRPSERQAAPVWPTFNADFVGIGSADLAIAADDVVVSAKDSTAYRVLGVPSTDQGFWMAPLAPCEVPT